MNILKKILIICIAFIYGYSQSIFAHLIVINQHHNNSINIEDYIHNNIDRHETAQTNGCNDKKCQTTCNDIESSKTCIYQTYKLLGESKYSHIISFVSFFISYNDTNKQEKTITNTGPPILIESLMPRVGPIVRII